MPISLVALVLLVAGSASAAEVYVSPAGDDANAGTREAPLATLEAARDAARRAGGDGGVTVVLMPGRYTRTGTFTLDSADSGREDAPVVYKAVRTGEAVLDGGVEVPADAVGPVTAEAVLARLIPAVREGVRQVDLAPLDLGDLGQVGPRGFGRAGLDAPVEPFMDGQEMRLARWPNPGEPLVPLGKVIDKGSVPRRGDTAGRGGIFQVNTPRAARWVNAEDLYLAGFFSHGYADDMVGIDRIDTAHGTFVTSQPHQYGFGTDDPALHRWYAVNLLEEIDEPGEYFIDRAKRVLYFLPDPRKGPGQIRLSVLNAPMLVVRDASHLRIEGLTFEYARGRGIEISGGSDVVVAGCTLRNLGGLAAKIEGGKANGLQSCDIYQTGAGGVRMDGGTRPTLEPAGHFVRNCDIHHVNRWYRTYTPPVAIRGVGNVIAHCHLHDCPGQAITAGGNDHVIELNEIDRVLTDMSDQGAIYIGRDIAAAGNVYRHNYFHDIGCTHESGHGNEAIFFDDGVSGQRVEGNVFVRIGSNGAVKYHGGQFNRFINNLVVACAGAVALTPWDQRRWDAFLHGQREGLEKNGIDLTKPPWSRKYPEHARVFGSRYSNSSHIEQRNVVAASLSEAMARAARTPGFEPIPIREIGLQQDAYRRAMTPAPAEPTPARRAPSKRLLFPSR